MSEQKELSLLTMLRLGLLYFGHGMMGLLIFGILNRIMIDDGLLGIPASITSFCTSMVYFIAVANIPLGKLTDSRKFFGYQRSGYLWFGLLINGITLIVASWFVLTYANHVSVWFVLFLVLLFLIHGLAKSLYLVAGYGLISDIATPKARGRIMGIEWSMVIMGLVVGAIVSGKILEGVDSSNLHEFMPKFFLGTVTFFMVLGFIATIGLEKNHSLRKSDSDNVKLTYKSIKKLFFVDKNPGYYFLFLFAISIGLFIQQPILEPFAGEVLGWSIAATTKLNAVWGVSLLIGLFFTGFAINKKFSKIKAIKLGGVISILGYILIILSAYQVSDSVFVTGVFIFGLGSGIAMNGSLGLILELTVPETAATFMGTYSLAYQFAQGIAINFGGISFDIGKWIFATYTDAYTLPYALSIGFIILSLYFVDKINVEEYQQESGELMKQIMEAQISD